MATKNAAITEEFSKPHVALYSQISQSSYLLSLPSEPPDIRNWFSSYEYASPATSDLEGGFRDLQPSTNEEIGFEKEEIAECIERGKKFADEDGDCDKSRKGFESFLEDSKQECYQDKKIMDSSHLLSLPSEPPDIRNWFSSYEYESPAMLDLDCGFNCLVTSEKGNEYGKEKILRSTKNFKVVTDDHELAEGERILEDSVQGCFLETEWKGQLLHKCHYIPQLNKVNSSAEDKECCLERFNDKGFTKNSPASLEGDDNSFRNQGKSMEKPIPIVHLKEEERRQKDLSEHIVPESNISREGLNEHKDFTDNGFISTGNRTRKSNTRSSKELGMRKDENSSTGEHFIAMGEVSQSENARVLLREEARKSVSDGRRALSDRTNFFTESDSEISGKWHCPRRSKPFVGPPLKQLRLERWVHRVL